MVYPVFSFTLPIGIATLPLPKEPVSIGSRISSAAKDLLGKHKPESSAAGKKEFTACNHSNIAKNCM